MTAAVFGVIFIAAQAVFYWFCGKSLKDSEGRFQKRRVSLEGTIIGYVRQAHTKKLSVCYLNPIVSFAINGEVIEREADSDYMNRNTHPIGSKVKILYCDPKVFRGKLFVGTRDIVRIDEEGFRPRPITTVIIMIRSFSIICFAAAIIVGIIAANA